MFKFNHFCFNVLDLQRSLDFYDKALGLKPVREKNAADGSFKLVFLGDGASDFSLELTWLRDRTEPYDLGDEEYHLAFTAEDMDAARMPETTMPHTKEGSMILDRTTKMFSAADAVSS